jgi:zinc protease
MMGYGNFTPNELKKQESGKNMNVSVELGKITDKINGRSNVENIENMMQLLYLKLTSPKKDEEAFMRWKNNYRTQIDNIYAKPEIFFIDTFATVKYNDNPLFVGIPGAEDLKELHLKRMIEIYKSEFGYADGYHFFMTGNIDTTKLLPLLELYLGSLPQSGIAAVCKDNGVRPITGVNKFTIYKGKEKKSHIISEYYGDIDYSEGTERNMKAMADILNMKVLQNLREKMSDIYTGGFSASILTYPNIHYSITLSLPCGPEHVQELLAAADNEISNMKNNGPTQEDLQKVKVQLYEKNQLNLKENSYWNTELEKILYSHKSKDNFINYKAFIDVMSVADIQSTARQVFDGKNVLTGILMPE